MNDYCLLYIFRNTNDLMKNALAVYDKAISLSTKSQLISKARHEEKVNF